MDDVMTLCKTEPMVQNEEFQLQMTCWDTKFQEGCGALIIVKKQQIKHRIGCDDIDYYVFKCPCCGLEHRIPDYLIPRKIQSELIGPDYSFIIFAGIIGFAIISTIIMAVAPNFLG